MTEIQEKVGGVALVLLVTKGGTPVTLTGSGTRVMLLAHVESGYTLTRTATFLTSPGMMSYVLVEGELTPAGMWQIQGLISVTGLQGHTTPAKFLVKSNV